MEIFSIFEVVKQTMIGKSIKYCVSHTPITQEYLVAKKKSSGVTDAQFKSGNPRFITYITRRKNIGQHNIYETSKIVDVRISYGNGYDGYNGIILLLETGRELILEVDTTLKEIEKDIYMESWLK